MLPSSGFSVVDNHAHVKAPLKARNIQIQNLIQIIIVIASLRELLCKYIEFQQRSTYTHTQNKIQQINK